MFIIFKKILIFYTKKQSIFRSYEQAKVVYKNQNHQEYSKFGKGQKHNKDEVENSSGLISLPSLALNTLYRENGYMTRSLEFVGESPLVVWLWIVPDRYNIVMVKILGKNNIAPQ